MKTFSIHTLGCKVNAYESEYYRQCLIDAGYTETEGFDDCDLVIINTCTVTNQASFKSRQRIHQAKKHNPTAKLVVVGCYVQSDHAELSAKYAIDLLIGSNQKDRFMELINQLDEPTTPSFALDRTFENLPVNSFKNKTRAYVKIQDGCNQFCTYCIIPYTRGRERSLNPDAVIEQVKRLQADHFEVVLAGIHTGKYGSDVNSNLATLLTRILEETTVQRIRLSSIDINEVDDPLIEVLRNPRMARHLHISLQSGDNDVLKAMNRPYTADHFKQRVDHIRSVIPDISISTDIIVGFSTETEAAFENTLAFAQTIRFSFIHVFPYSVRKMTKAANFPQLNSEQVKKERVHRLSAVSNALQQQRFERLVGEVVEVLIEHHDSRGYHGYSSAYDAVCLPTETPLHGIIQAVVTGFEPDTLMAQPL